jgi:hypothetical protein
MSSFQQPDLAGLAMLARSGDRELRPVLLTLHTRAFVSAARDRRSIATYEALALGLIPLVPDDVVADIWAMLRQVPEAPARVMALLGERRSARSVLDPISRARAAGLTRLDVADLVILADAGVDLALACNPAAPLDAHARNELVTRATRNGDLARALLARSELSAVEKGDLFAFATEAAERDRIREELEIAGAAARAPLPSLSTWRRTRLLRAAAKADMPALLTELGRALGLAPTPEWRLDEAIEAELFALALVAAGLPVEDCVRVLLTADPRIASSVPAVFRLRQVCRSTSRAVAWRLLGAQQPARKAGAAKTSGAARGKQAENARAVSAMEPARPSRARPASAPAGRRSRSTTGPDRS